MHKFVNPETGLEQELSDLEWQKMHDETLLAWERTKKDLDIAKEAELMLRKRYVALASNPDKVKGTENVQLPNGYKAKIVKNQRFGFIKGPDNQVDIDAVDAVADAISEMGNEGAFLHARLIKFKPELSASEYGKLDLSNPTHVKIKDAIDSVLVTTPATPTLAIVAPKK